MSLVMTRRPHFKLIDMNTKQLFAVLMCLCALNTGRVWGQRDLDAPHILQGDELTLEPGMNLNITCRDSFPVAWCTDHEGFTSENYGETFDVGHPQPYVANLLIEHVNFTHVGYYSCIHNTTENKKKQTCDVKDPLVSSIYVYVRDENNLLTTDTQTVFFHPVVGTPFILPCKPTFRDVVVELKDIQGDFIPREGFSFTIYDQNDSANLRCTASYGGKTAEQTAIIVPILSQDKELSPPIVEVANHWQLNSVIDDNNDHYDVIEGDSVNLTCSCTFPSYHTKNLRWKVPDHITNETGSHRVYRYTKHDSQLNRTYVILNADPTMDSGEYKCIASSNGQSSESNTIVIDVLPKASVFVELKTDHPNITLSGNPIRWEIDYHAYPKPDFLWFNEGRDVLVDSSKMYEGAKRFRLYEIHESGSITLNIEKPNVMDIGEYTLEANTSNGEKVASDTIKMFFSMPVEPRDMILTRSSNDLMIKENHSFRLNCEVKGYPKPDIYLEFQLCHSKGNCSDFLQLSRDESAPYNKLDQGTAKEPFHIFRESVTWNGRAQNQGYYRCVASNNLNSTTSSPLEFLVTDSDNATAYVSLEVVVNGKNQRSTSVVVLEGDDLIFRCIGNKMATNELSWMLNRNPLEEDLEKEWGLTVQKADSELSYISEIIIQNLTRMENFSLSCMEESVSLYSVTRLIQVKPMIAPKWKDGSSSPLRDYSLHEMGNLTMDCSADGTPPPEVTWYKDNVMLDKTLKHPEVIGNQISFHFLKTSDAGHYLCEVTNRAGTITSESYVKVFDPDAFVDTNVLIIVGVLVFILLVIMIFFSRKIYQDRKRALGLRLKEQKMFIEGDPGSLNPEIGLDQQAELLPYDSKYEMPRDSIIFDKLLGVGAFGRVYRATAINLVPGKACTTVAVKMMKSRTDSSQLKALRSEVKIMIHIGRHVNIVNLLGACSKDLASKGELLLLVEYCKYGNILDYMHRHRKEFINQINDDDKIDPSITDQRMRQRSGSGSRGRTSRGLKYARLSFNQDAVHYTNRQIPDSEHSNQTFLGQPSSPLLSPTMNGEVPGLFRNRNVSTSSSHHVTSDMSTLTYESSSGASDGYISSQVVGSNPANLCSKVLLCWAFQIARGMEYLAFKKVLHGDLAARNVLLAEDNIVKISDFGLAKDIYKDKNYKKKSGGPVPVKWLALECLRDCVFSTQSDVWSFGVVLWEIFSLGQNPYPGVEFDENFIVKLEKGVRLEQPRYSTYALYRIMLDCWNSEPLERPTFSNLEQRLGEILGEAEKQYYLELNQPYQVDNNESSFLNLLQSPDYSAKVHGVHPNLDADGYEMPFSPSPFGVNALPEAEIQNLHPQTPRLTSLQMEFIQQETGMDSGSSAGTYLSMSSPTRKNQNVFKFDHEAVASMAMQDNEILQEYCEGIEEPCDVYLNMDSGPKINRSVSHESQQNTPLRISVEDVSEIYTSPNHQDNGSSCVALRHKIIRTVSENEKHDSGLYSPTACMQTNPNYMIMNSFSDTDESNCLTKEDAQDMENCHLDQPQYINFDAVKFTSKSVPREYMKEGRCDEEYVNLLPSEGCRGRTISEASSGLGSIAEETPPESRAKPDYLKSPVMGSPIIEEPVAA